MGNAGSYLKGYEQALKICAGWSSNIIHDVSFSPQVDLILSCREGFPTW